MSSIFKATLYDFKHPIFKPGGKKILDPLSRDFNVLYREIEQETIYGSIIYDSDRTLLVCGPSGSGKTSVIRKVSNKIIEDHGGKYFEGDSSFSNEEGKERIYVYHMRFLRSLQSIPKYITNRPVKEHRAGGYNYIPIEDHSSDIKPVVIIDQLDMYLRGKEDIENLLANLFDSITEDVGKAKIVGVALEEINGFDRCLQFKPYRRIEVDGILDNKTKRAFQPDVLDGDVLRNSVEITVERFHSNISEAMNTLMSSAKTAAKKQSNKITLEYFQEALENKSAKEKIIESLSDEQQKVLNAMNELPLIYKNRINFNMRDIYEKYKELGGSSNIADVEKQAKDIDEQSLDDWCEITNEQGILTKKSIFLLEPINEEAVSDLSETLVTEKNQIF